MEGVGFSREWFVLLVVMRYHPTAGACALHSQKLWFDKKADAEFAANEILSGVDPNVRVDVVKLYRI